MVVRASGENAQWNPQGIIIIFLQVEDVDGVSDRDVALRAFNGTQDLRNLNVDKRSLLVLENFHDFLLFHVPSVGQQFFIISHVLELQGVDVRKFVEVDVVLDSEVVVAFLD